MRRRHAVPSSQPVAPQASGLKPQASRRGISLLEVLISMFIIMIGLVGVSSLVYVGRHEVQEGGRLDRANNVGRAAINDIRIRGLLGPRFQPVANSPTLLRSEIWAVGSVPLSPLVYNTQTDVYRYDYQTPNPPVPSLAPAPYVIDPLGVAAQFGAVFPYGAWAPMDPQSAPLAIPGLIRLTVLPPGLTDAQRSALTQAQLQSIAEEVFRAQDDLVATFKPSTQNPATQQFTISSGVPIKRQSTGEYSWLATIVPRQTSEFTNNLMTVSVAVFHKRKLSIPGIGERPVYVKEVLPGSPLEVILKSPKNFTDGNGKTTADQFGTVLLNVRAGQWLMLNGSAPKVSNPTKLSDFTIYHKWFRIVGMDDAPDTDPDDSNYNIRRVSLAGADWNGNCVIAFPPAVSGTTTSAFLFDGIVGVYEKAMHLEGPSEWTNY